MNLQVDDEKYVWHPFTQVKTERSPIIITHAIDATLIASDGSRYLDCNSSWWVNVHGHGNEHIADALQDQFHQIDHVIFAGVTHPKAIELAKRVCEKLNNNLKKVFFSDNGSTAVEVALKMAIQFWHNQKVHRPKILALEGAYHGDTFGAMSVGERDCFNVPFEPYFFEVDYLPFPSADSEIQILNHAEILLKTKEFACLIVEPLVQGSAGMRIYSIEFLEKLTILAKKHNTIVIYDEIMTGFGRTGKLFAFEHTSVHPDIICLSKGLTGGVLPLGLTVSTLAIFDAFLSDNRAKAFLHGHSFTGNPLACAAACASLDLFENQETWIKINAISKSNETFVETIKFHPQVKDVRCIGTILAIELNDTQSGYFSQKKEIAYHYFLDNGLLLRPLGNVIFINPPYCLTQKEQLKIFDVIVQFLNQLNGNQ
jgi:adenosylmethionine-8-amino-7-oxononanoate aminotransferase